MGGRRTLFHVASREDTHVREADTDWMERYHGLGWAAEP